MTVTSRLRVARKALLWWLGDERNCIERLRRLQVADVEAFLLRLHEDGLARATQQVMRSDLRSFLRYCEAEGWVSPRFSTCVPSMRRYRLSGLPRGVSDEDLSTLLGALKTSGPAARRNRAIVLLLATYGVRRGHVAALRLGDVDWPRKQVTFPAHKGGRAVQHTLTAVVAEALADYLVHRPACDVEEVFLRLASPPRPISPRAITHVVASLFDAAGLKATPHGPHTLRHAFAQRLLESGQSLKTVADLLGHRSFSSAAVYTKVDMPRLREVPLEWPEVQQ